jgi:tetratricopeptide (TPR) repeat protein
MRISQQTFRIVALVVLFGSACAKADSQVPGAGREYIISGSVHWDDNDAPVPEVRVQLRTELGNVAHPTVLTNRNGEFYFGQYHPAEYEIVAELEGYQVVRVRVDITRHDELNVLIRLRRDPTGAAPAGNVTSAHNLAVPKKAQAAFDKGVSAGSKGNYKAAIEQFQSAIEIFPDYYEAHAQIGMAFVRMKDFPAAEKALRKSIELSSEKYAPPLMLLSMVLNDQNRPADAEAVARQAVLADPNAWRGAYELSRALLSLHRAPEAEAAAITARGIDPGIPDVYLLLSEIHRALQNAPALLQDLDSYLRLAPDGQAAPQARKLREQLVKFMESQSKPVP